MTLRELSKEYEKEEEKLTKQIQSYLPVVSTLSGEKKHAAQRRLLCLYEMRREVRITAGILKNYYENRSERRIYHKS